MAREVVRLHAAQAAFRKSAALYRGFVGGISSLGARALRPRTSQSPHPVPLRGDRGDWGDWGNCVQSPRYRKTRTGETGETVYFSGVRPVSPHPKICQSPRLWIYSLPGDVPRRRSFRASVATLFR